jgi:diadenosine tetraphosphate (Ap4A) HIT family hydrolase
MNTPADCLICRKHRGEFIVPGGAIYQDDLIYASHAHIAEGKTTAYLGWVVVETKRHAPGLSELTDAEAQAVGQWAARLGRALKATEGVEHVYAFAIGDGIKHFHIHVLPRYPAAPREYWGTRVDEWPEAPHGGPDAIRALCTRLRAFLHIKP